MEIVINTEGGSYINNRGQKLTVDDLLKAEQEFSKLVNEVLQSQPLILIESPKPLPCESN